MNWTFDTETWKYIVIASGIVLMAFLWLWGIAEVRALRRAVTTNTEVARLWMLAFDNARKAKTVYPVCDEPEHPNDLMK